MTPEQRELAEATALAFCTPDRRRTCEEAVRHNGIHAAATEAAEELVYRLAVFLMHHAPPAGPGAVHSIPGVVAIPDFFWRHLKPAIAEQAKGQSIRAIIEAEWPSAPGWTGVALVLCHA